jgi:hypothetical protein
MKVIDLLLNVIEIYINEIKKKNILLNEETVETISIIFFQHRIVWINKRI